MHCRVLGSTPGLCLLADSSMNPLTYFLVVTTKMFPDIAKVSLGGEAKASFAEISGSREGSPVSPQLVQLTSSLP